MTQPQPEYIITEDHLKMIESRGFRWMARLIRSRTHTPAAPVTDALADLKITASMLYEFCEWFCDYDCEENPCTVTVSRLHERIEGIQNQMKAHPEYLKKWEAKRAEQEHLRKEASGDECG